MRIAVTGGAGFIGSHVVDRLVAADHDVVVLDVRPPHRADVDYQRVSVLDNAALARGLRDCSTVFHLAGVANVNEAAAEPVRTAELNVTGTARVWRAARECGVTRAVLASTVWVYGAAIENGGPADETAVFDVRRAGHIYTASKLGAELVVHSCHELYGQEYTILRYGIPFGPRMRDELVIAKFVERALSGEPIVVHGDGSQYRNYVYVEDLAQAHVLALGPLGANQTFNLEGQEPVTVRQLVDSIVEVAPRKVAFQFGDARPGDYAGRAVSADYARAVLGWQPRVSFAEGLRRYVDWYAAEGTPRPPGRVRRSAAAVRTAAMRPAPLLLAVLALPALAVHGAVPVGIAGRAAVSALAVAAASITARWGPNPTPRFAGVVLCLAGIWLVSQAAGPLVPVVAVFLGAGVGLLITHRRPPSPVAGVGVAAVAAALVVVGIAVPGALVWLMGAALILDAARGLVVEAVGHHVVDAGAVMAAAILAAVVGATSVRAGWFAPPLGHGTRSRGEVALTFDASDPAAVSTVADALEGEHVKATFFIAGKDVRAHPMLMRAILDREQLVGNATYDRNPLRVFDPWVGGHVIEQRVFRDGGRVCPAFMRLPGGYHTPLLKWSAGHHGVSMVGGDVAVSVRRRPDPSVVTGRVLTGARAGSIVKIDITHGGPLGAQAVAASVPAIVQGLRDRNLRPVTLDGLLGRPSYVGHC